MKVYFTLFLIALLSSCSFPDSTPFSELKPDVQTQVQACRTCHDQGQQVSAPNIYGLESWYLREQVLKFKSGMRGGNGDTQPAQAMHASLKDLTDDQVIAAARWFAGQERPSFKATVVGDATLGKELYQKNCASCHDKTFLRIVTHSPKIAKLEDWYFLQQCINFDSGTRGGPQDNDHGKSMKEKIKRVPAENFKDLAAYIHSLK